MIHPVAMEHDPACPRHKVLPAGTVVRVSDVDQYGFCGRERHPHRSDVGLVGRIVLALAMDEAGDEMSTEPGTVVDGDQDEWCSYHVVLDDGRILDLMSFEIEVVR